jgi:hypothetical protein
VHPSLPELREAVREWIAAGNEEMAVTLRAERPATFGDVVTVTDMLRELGVEPGLQMGKEVRATEGGDPSSPPVHPALRDAVRRQPEREPIDEPLRLKADKDTSFEEVLALMNELSDPYRRFWELAAGRAPEDPPSRAPSTPIPMPPVDVVDIVDRDEPPAPGFVRRTQPGPEFRAGQVWDCPGPSGDPVRLTIRRVEEIDGAGGIAFVSFPGFEDSEKLPSIPAAFVGFATVTLREHVAEMVEQVSVGTSDAAFAVWQYWFERGGRGYELRSPWEYLWSRRILLGDAPLDLPSARRR